MKHLVPIALLVLAVACGDPPPTEGYVTRHEYDDPDTIYHPGYTIDGGQSCSGGYGNPPSPRVCTDNPDIYVPGWTEHQPEQFIFHIRKESVTKNDKGEVKVKVHSGNCRVDHDTYNEVHDGQYFDCKTGQVIPK